MARRRWFRGCSSRFLLRLLLLAQGIRGAGAACAVNNFSSLATLSPSATGWFRSLAWVPGSENNGTDLLIAGGEDQKLRVWAISGTGSGASGSLINTLGAIEGTIWALEWVASQSLLFVGSGDGRIRAWPLAVLNTPQACRVEALGNGNDLCCDGDGLGCEGKHVVSWRDVPMPRHRQVFALEWIESENLLASSWADGVVRFWTYTAGATPPLTYRNTLSVTGRAYSLTWLAGPQQLAIISPDWTLPELWDKDGTTTAARVLTKQLPYGFGYCPTAHCGAVHASSADAAGTTLATASEDWKVKLWTGATGAMAHDFLGHSDEVTAIEWMHSESKLVSGDQSGALFLWDPTDTSTSASLASVPAAHTGKVSALQWMGDLDVLATAGYDMTVRLWHCAS